MKENLYQKIKLQDISAYEEELKLLRKKYADFRNNRWSEIQTAVKECVDFIESEIIHWRLYHGNSKRKIEYKPKKVFHSLGGHRTRGMQTLEDLRNFNTYESHKIIWLREFINKYHSLKPSEPLKERLGDEISKIKEKRFLLGSEEKRINLINKAERDFEKSVEEYNDSLLKYQKTRDYFNLLSEFLEIEPRIDHLERMLSVAQKKKKDIEKNSANRKVEYLKHEKAYAKAASLDQRTRSRSMAVMSKLEITCECPYCGSELGNNPHADHIYPVSAGGLSTIENMAYCCNQCNIKKRDKGLLDFLLSEGYDVQQVISKLVRMGKKI